MIEYVLPLFAGGSIGLAYSRFNEMLTYNHAVLHRNIKYYSI